MELCLGAIGAAAAVALFFAGAALGWRARAALPHVSAKEPGEEELRRLREEQEAFRELQRYSAEVAYGVRERGDGP